MILPTAFIKLENKNKVWVLSVHEWTVSQLCSYSSWMNCYVVTVHEWTVTT
jgi:hypothetical protein